MSGKEGKKDTTEDGNQGDESGQKMLYRLIFDPSKERLPELTDIPLMQQTPLTWMATFDEAIEWCVLRIKYARDLRRYNNFLAYGGEKMKKPTIPKAILLPERWREWYYKHRRSLAGSGVKTAAVLAERQLEVQGEQPSADQLGVIARD